MVCGQGVQLQFLAGQAQRQVQSSSVQSQFPGTQQGGAGRHRPAGGQFGQPLEQVGLPESGCSHTGLAEQFHRQVGTAPLPGQHGPVEARAEQVGPGLRGAPEQPGRSLRPVLQHAGDGQGVDGGRGPGLGGYCPLQFSLGFRGAPQGQQGQGTDVAGEMVMAAGASGQQTQGLPGVVVEDHCQRQGAGKGRLVGSRFFAQQGHNPAGLAGGQ